MRRTSYGLMLLAFVGFLILSSANLFSPAFANTNAQDDEKYIEHVVKQGENLYRIAQQYNVTVAEIVEANGLANPNDIVVGQTLRIPLREGVITPQATTPPATTLVPTTATPTMTTTLPPNTHRVQRGENLYGIARMYNVTVRELMRLNPTITNPNIIFVGQLIQLPEGTSLTATVATSTTPAITAVATTLVPTADGTTPVTAQPVTPVATETATEVVVETPTPDVTSTQTPETDLPLSTAPEVGFRYGVQIYTLDQDANIILQRVNELRMEWVKIEVEWRIIEVTEGQYDFTKLSSILDLLAGTSVNVMLQVYAAPDWARTTTEESGPATDNQNYANFLTALLQRFPNQIQAIEVWKQPNLRSYWNGQPLGGANYVELLEGAYRAIKSVDSSVVVVTAGLAPTGLNDGMNAIADRDFLRQMYAADVALVSDAVGANPSGYGNPPDENCCFTGENPQWNNDPTFFFLDTLQDYHEIMVENGDDALLWVTEFGWASLDNTGIANPSQINAPTVGGVSIFAFATLNNADEQALYTLEAFTVGRNEGYIGPMFIYNLNYCGALSRGEPACLWSMLDPAGNPRPVFLVIRDMAR